MPPIAIDNLDSMAEAAFRVAARKVIEDARRANTGIVTWRNGRVLEISCDEAEAELAAAEAAPARSSISR